VIGGFAFMESRAMMNLVLRHLGDFPSTSHALHLNNQAFLFKIIVAIAFTGAFQILFGIYASHKLAGPVHKMTGILERAGRGDFSQRAAFRTDDQLEELSASLNGALDSLAAEQRSWRSELAGIEETLARLESLPPSAGVDAEVEEIRRRLARLSGVEYHALETVGS
jgi:nitrogen fixation/metabolism regulation signal transduction histidine kinase